MSKKRALVFALCVFLLPAAAQGQGVRWESTGKVEFGGALGLIAGLVGGGDATSGYALQDGRWLIDSESSGTVYDYREGNFTAIDHESRTYFTTSFADMAQALEARAAEARQRVEDARAEEGEEAPLAGSDPDASDVNLGVNVSVDRPGDRREIAGYDAERFIVTVEIGGEVTSEDETTVLPGTLVLLTDVWMSRDFPADRLLRQMFQEHPEWADQQGLREAGSGLQEAFALDGRIKLALEEGDLPPQTFLPPPSYQERVPEWLTAGVSC